MLRADQVIISFCEVEDAEARTIQPKIIRVDEKNRIKAS